MKFLIDTNVLIPLEPASHADEEVNSQNAREFYRLVTETRNQIYVHPLARKDIEEDHDQDRKSLRAKLLEKYSMLPEPPSISAELQTRIGSSLRGSNDWVDDHLIAAMFSNAADYLVTEDQKLIRKAMKAGLSDKVFRIAEAIAFLSTLYDKTPCPPPRVESAKCHSLNARDPIFESLRADYPGFDKWFSKCQQEHRPVWRIQSNDGRLGAICIVKQEERDTFGLAGKVMKICAFKVSDGATGAKFGELLLKTVFDYAWQNKYDWLFVTVFEKHAGLQQLLTDFGFRSLDCRTNLGELIYAKPFAPQLSEDNTDALGFNIRYGPYTILQNATVPIFIVPIMPKYHALLFPEAERQLVLSPGEHPFGNSIRKAYLCNSNIRTVTPGSLLLFYRSGDAQHVDVLGVVEGTLVSRDPVSVLSQVSKRTVYSLHDIEKLCESDVLAILFRQSRILSAPIQLEEMLKAGVLAAHPQTITTIQQQHRAWIFNRLNT
jgi:predicted nucleic acid-binding protein/L-amino acid N-acyltransferase YncA